MLIYYFSKTLRTSDRGVAILNSLDWNGVLLRTVKKIWEPTTLIPAMPRATTSTLTCGANSCRERITYYKVQTNYSQHGVKMDRSTPTMRCITMDRSMGCTSMVKLQRIIYGSEDVRKVNTMIVIVRFKKYRFRFSDHEVMTH